MHRLTLLFVDAAGHFILCFVVPTHHIPSYSMSIPHVVLLTAFDHCPIQDVTDVGAASALRQPLA